MATYTQDGVLIEDEQTANPDVRRAKVPHGMPMPNFVTSRTAGPEFDVWYYPTQMAYLTNSFFENYSAWQDNVGTAVDKAVNAVGDVVDGAGTAGKWVIVGLGFFALIQLLDKVKR